MNMNSKSGDVRHLRTFLFVNFSPQTPYLLKKRICENGEKYFNIGVQTSKRPKTSEVVL